MKSVVEHEGRSLISGVSILTKENPESSLAPSTKWGPGEKTAIYEEAVLAWHQICRRLDLGPVQTKTMRLDWSQNYHAITPLLCILPFPGLSLPTSIFSWHVLNQSFVHKSLLKGLYLRTQPEIRNFMKKHFLITFSWVSILLHFIHSFTHSFMHLHIFNKYICKYYYYKLDSGFINTFL